MAGPEDQRRNESIALLAHELRNLLAPIRYALASMEKTDTTPQQRYALEVMRRQSAQMSRLLDDLLDVWRFTRGDSVLRKGVADLAVVLRTAVEAARPILDAKDHSLTCELPEADLRIWADPVRLIQVFSNLLINAAKYTDRGGTVELRVVLEGDSVLVSVCDSGIGISQQMMPQIFQLFAQDPQARSRSEGGLGIGLALVYGIVTLHGGTINVRSEGPNRGSQFIVRLPFGKAHIEPSPVTPVSHAARDRNLRVLVVDDNKDVADTCAMLVSLSGHQVETVYTARQALERAESFRPDVILTDIGLPDIDGYEFAKRIRSMTWGARTILVAITGWTEEEHRRQPLGDIFSHHLTKPIDPSTIEALLARIVF